MPLVELKSLLSLQGGNQPSEPGGNIGGQTPQLNEQPITIRNKTRNTTISTTKQ